MKNFSKLLALGVALSLTFGMTAFAAESPSTAVDGTTQEQLTKIAENIGKTEGVTVEMTVHTQNRGAQMLENTSAVKSMASDAAKVLDAKEVEILALAAAMDITGTPNEPITLTNVPNVKASKEYVLLHWKSKGGTEIIPVTVNGDGSITFTVSAFSDFALYEAKITPKVDDEDDDNDDSNDTPAVTADGAPASPKTGETLPVAGIAMMIALAGAAVCAKKVRYNN